MRSYRGSWGRTENGRTISERGLETGVHVARAAIRLDGRTLCQSLRARPLEPRGTRCTQGPLRRVDSSFPLGDARTGILSRVHRQCGVPRRLVRPHIGVHTRLRELRVLRKCPFDGGQKSWIVFEGSFVPVVRLLIPRWVQRDIYAVSIVTTKACQNVWR